MQEPVSKVIKATSTVVIVCYLLLRGLVTMVFMPLVVPPTDWHFWVMGGLYLVAIVISLVSFFGNSRAASIAVLAYALCTILLYLLTIYRGRFILSDFCWFVPPDVLFAAFICLRDGADGRQSKPKINLKKVTDFRT